MLRSKYINTPLLVLLFALLLVPHAINAQPDQFDKLLEDFYQEGLKLSPLVATVNNGDNRYNDQLEIDISDEYRTAFVNYYKKYKSQLTQFERSSLSEDRQMSYDILLWECNINIEGGKYRADLMPINQLFAMPLMMGQLASGMGAQPFASMKDYDNWLKRLDGLVEWTDLSIVKMREGIKEGYVLPKPLTERMIPQYESLAIGPVEDHLYYGAVKNMPETFSKKESARIKKAYLDKIQNVIIPAFNRLHTFLKDEYLPNSRETDGLGGLPNGLAYYNYLIKLQTTTELDADQIYKIGLAEVTRIRFEMMKVKEQVGFEGSLLEFFNDVRSNKKLMPFKTAEEVLANFERIHQRIGPKVKEQFDFNPKIAFEIRRVEAFREATTSAHYMMGSPDGSRPGIFYVPIPDATKYNTYSDESLFLHEAIPGHHFQASVGLENTSLPTFRKFVWYGAHGEGWALYCESLGKELGLFTDPYQYFGMLGSEMHRAIRLVVDAGIHSKDWTREQAIQYSLENEALAEDIIISEVERYMAWPAQALSYKIGQLKIQELRAKAEHEMGVNFDVKKFHRKVLESGGLPIKILEQKIDAWIATNNKS